jgi:TIMELESS-interacting protein
MDERKASSDNTKEDEILITKEKNKGSTRIYFNEDLLCSEEGLPKIYETFPKKCKFRGRGYETADLKNMLSCYKEWAFFLHPGIAFQDVLNSCERFGRMKQTKEALDKLRNIERTRYGELLVEGPAVPQKKVRFKTENDAM